MSSAAVCINCGSTQADPYAETESARGDRFLLRRCLACDAVFLSPQPTSEQLAAAYSSDYYGGDKAKFSSGIERAIDWYRSARARKVSTRVTPGGAVLDIGCGNGKFLEQLIVRGYRCSGVEHPGPAAERARAIPGLDLKVGAFTGSMFDGNHFDAITLWHVLEHLPEPRKVLGELAALVPQGGRLFLSVPNIESFQSRLFLGKWFHVDAPRHLIFLSETALIRELSAAGFRHESTNYFSLEYNPFGWQQSLLNCLVRSRNELYDSLKRPLSFAVPPRILLQQLFFVLTFPLFAVLSIVESLLHRGGTMELIFQKT